MRHERSAMASGAPGFRPRRQPALRPTFGSGESTDASYRTTDPVRAAAPGHLCLARPVRLPRQPGAATLGRRCVLHAAVHRAAPDPHADGTVEHVPSARAVLDARPLSGVAGPGTVRSRDP